MHNRSKPPAAAVSPTINCTELSSVMPEITLVFRFIETLVFLIIRFSSVLTLQGIIFKIGFYHD